MTRRTDQLNRIEEVLHRVETAAGVLADALAEHGTQLAAVRAEAKEARSAASAALAGISALVPPAPPAEVTSQADGGGTEGEPVTAAVRAPKTLKPPKGM